MASAELVSGRVLAALTGRSRMRTVPREGFATCVPISPLPSATN